MASSVSSSSTISHELVEDELRSILASPAFSGSRRCCDFLQFIVQRTLEGRSGELKERTIASEVFGRDALYEPKLDALVRVRANDLRKRLAQYYLEAGSHAKVRIDLPLGSYIPSLELLPAAIQPPKEIQEVPRNGARSPRRVWGIAAACVVLVAGIVWGALRLHARSDLQDFWGLLLANPQPVTICMMPTAIYDFPGGNVARQIVQPDRRHYEIGTDDLHFGPKLVYDVDGGFWAGDTLAAATVAHILGEMRKPMVLKTGDVVSFGDMKDGPAVLIGAFNNRWSMEMNTGLPVIYAPGSAIQDRLTGQVYRLRREQDRIVEDFGLISRLLSSKAGGPLVTIGGIKHTATLAAAEMVTNPDSLRSLVGKLPGDWRKRNIQIIVKTKLRQERAGPPEVVAVHVW